MNAKSIILLALLAAEQNPQDKTFAILAVLAAIILLFAVIVFLTKRSRKPGPCYFPEHPIQPRLGAPYAGGNHAMRDLGPPLP